MTCIILDCDRERDGRNAAFCQHHRAGAAEIGHMRDALEAADALVATLYDTDYSLRPATPAQRVQRVIERLEGYVAARAMVESSASTVPSEGSSDA